MNVLTAIEKELIPQDKEFNFEIGDTVKVHYKIIEKEAKAAVKGTKGAKKEEKERERIQVYEGIVIAIDGKGVNKTFTVRKISFEIGVERVFPLFSPKIAKIETIRKGKVRRAKLYFLRERKGKSAKLKEKRMKSPKLAKPVKQVVEQVVQAVPEAQAAE